MTQDLAKFAVNSYAYTMTHAATDFITHLVDQGVREFELMMYPGHIWPAHTDAAARTALRRHVDSHGARVTTLNMPNLDVNIAAATEEMRAHSLEHLRKVVDLAGDLEVPGVVLGIGKANPLFPAPMDLLTGYFYAALDDLAPRAKARGTALWVENMPFSFVGDVPTLMDMLDKYGNDDIGFVYDVANGHFIKEDVGDGLRRVVDRLKLVHVSDTNQQVYKHDPVGCGDLDFAAVPPVLGEIGYTGLVMLEIITLDPDREIPDSATKLVSAGFGA